MFNYCISADRHLGACLEEQLEACSSLLINNIEISAEIDGVSLDSLSGGKVEYIRNQLIRSNKKIVLLEVDFIQFSTERINLLFRKAHLIGVENVKIYRWGVGESETLVALDGLLSELLPIARSYGIGVVVENQRESCLSTENAISGLFSAYKEFQPGLVFNPLEFAATKRHPFFHVFYNSRLKPAISFLRVNDGLFLDGSPTLPACGNAEIKELVSALLSRSFQGYFSFHPYMAEMDFRQYCEVIERFRRLLMSM